MLQKRRKIHFFLKVVEGVKRWKICVFCKKVFKRISRSLKCLSRMCFHCKVTTRVTHAREGATSFAVALTGIRTGRIIVWETADCKQSKLNLALVHNGAIEKCIVSNKCSLRTADAFPVVVSLPPKNSYFRRERSDDRKCVCCSQATINAGFYKAVQHRDNILKKNDA